MTCVGEEPDAAVELAAAEPAVRLLRVDEPGAAPDASVAVTMNDEVDEGFALAAARLRAAVAVEVAADDDKDAVDEARLAEVEPPASADISDVSEGVFEETGVVAEEGPAAMRSPVDAVVAGISSAVGLSKDANSIEAAAVVEGSALIGGGAVV